MARAYPRHRPGRGGVLGDRAPGVVKAQGTALGEPGAARVQRRRLEKRPAAPSSDERGKARPNPSAGPSASGELPRVGRFV